MPLNIDFQQILLHMLNFVILAGGLYLLLYKPVKDFMDKRVQEYQSMEDQARLVMQQANDTKIEYEDKLANAQSEIDQMKAQANKELDMAAQEQKKHAQADAEQIIKVAHINAEREKQQMMDEAREEITLLASQAARKIIETGNDPYAQFVEASKGGQDNEN